MLQSMWSQRVEYDLSTEQYKYEKHLVLCLA